MILKNNTYRTKPNISLFNIFLVPWTICLVGVTIFLIFQYIYYFPRNIEVIIYILLMIVVNFLMIKYLRWAYLGLETLTISDNKIEVKYKYPFFSKNKSINLKDIFEVDYETFHTRYYFYVYGKIRVRYFGGIDYYGEGLDVREAKSISKEIDEYIQFKKSIIKKD